MEGVLRKNAVISVAICMAALLSMSFALVDGLQTTFDTFYVAEVSEKEVQSVRA